MYLRSSSSRTGSGLPDRPEINFSKVVVGGDIGGLVFVVGCVVAVLGGFPTFIPVFVASLVLGVLLAIGLIGWRRTHARRATSLRAAAVVLLMAGLSAGLAGAASGAEGLHDNREDVAMTAPASTASASLRCANR